MTLGLVLDNLLAWSAQICVLVAIGFLASLLLTHPRARLLFWQAILAVALLLPIIEPWQLPADAQTGGVTVSTGTVRIVASHAASSRWIWKREYLLGILAAGSLLRLLWIGAGLMRLRRHRLDAQMLTTPPVPFSNPSVRWFISSTVGGPVTFGFVNPSILLPTRVAELPADLREAIAHHELAHVRRGDWLFVVGEETIRSIFWFHPAIWIVLSRIQLAREQVVDAEVVGLTRDRQRYLHALVAVAAQRLLPDVAPAPLFLKKRQLAQRVAAVLKETRMSKPRAFFSFTTVCSAALVAARLAVWMFPLQAPAQTPQAAGARAPMMSDGPGVVVDAGAKVLHRLPVYYPSGVTTTGDVVVEMSVDTKGEVTDARIVSGPQELRTAVLRSVLGWHFSTDGGLAPVVQSTVHFTGAPKAPQTTVPSAPARSEPLVLAAIETILLPPDMAEKVQAAVTIRPGAPFGNAEFAQVRAEVKAIDEHFMLGMRTGSGTATVFVTLPGVAGGVTGGVTGGVAGGVPGGVAGGVRGGVIGGVIEGTPGVLIEEPTRAMVTSQPSRIRVGGNVQATMLIKKVTPMYPPEAKMARIEGTVRFTAIIGKDGSIINLDLVSGHPLLVQPAKDAVLQWMYKPVLLNDQPVEVITQIDVNFTLME